MRVTIIDQIRQTQGSINADSQQNLLAEEMSCKVQSDDVVCKFLPYKSLAQRLYKSNLFFAPF